MAPFGASDTFYQLGLLEWDNELFEILDGDILIPRDTGHTHGAFAVVFGKFYHKSCSVTTSSG